MTGWIEIPLGRRLGRKGPTWGAVARRFDRCSRRVAFYVGQHFRDPGTFERIVTEALERNLDLLVAEHDEIEEMRRLRATADRLIASERRAQSGTGGSRP